MRPLAFVLHLSEPFSQDFQAGKSLLDGWWAWPGYSLDQQQAQPPAARQPALTTVNGERVVNILDLAVDERGRPILPNFPSEPLDSTQSSRTQRPERKEKERKPKRADKQAAAPASTTDDGEVATSLDNSTALR